MRFLAVAGVTLRRIVRDRRALMFMLALPVAIIVIIGVTLGGVTRFRVGIVATGPGPVGQRLVTAVSDAPALRVTHFADESGRPRPCAGGRSPPTSSSPPASTAPFRPEDRQRSPWWLRPRPATAGPRSPRSTPS